MNLISLRIVCCIVLIIVLVIIAFTTDEVINSHLLASVGIIAGALINKWITTTRKIGNEEY